MSRVRDRSRTQTVAGAYRQIARDGSVSVSGTTLSLVKQHDVMVDTLTPRFKTRSAKGETIVSPMSKVVCTNSLRGLTWSCQGAPDDQGRRSTWYGMPWVPDRLVVDGNPVAAYPDLGTTVDKCVGIAVTDAAAKVGAADVEALVSLAELPETVAFLQKPLQGMVALTRRFMSWRRYRKRTLDRYAKAIERWSTLSAKQQARRKAPVKPELRPFKVGKFSAMDLPSAWLAYRYGIMPMIYEFEGIAKFLSDGPRPVRQTVRARAQETFRKKTNRSFQEGSDSDTGRIEVREEDDFNARVDVRAGFLYEVDWSVQSQLGLSPSRVPAALYELIPLSFVADWFWNGAEYYDALTAECRAKSILGGWAVSKITFEFTRTRSIVAIGPNTTVSGANPTVVIQESGVITRRTPKSTSDAKVHLRVALNTKRVADGLSLVLQMLAGRRH